jgi:predicted esterase
VIAIAGPVPLDTSELVKGLRRVPIRIMQGGKDTRVPPEGSRRLVADLKRADASVEYQEERVVPSTNFASAVKVPFGEDFIPSS